jgi:hypothetical protein
VLNVRLFAAKEWCGFFVPIPGTNNDKARVYVVEEGMELAIPKKEENKQWLESQEWNCQ